MLNSVFTDKGSDTQEGQQTAPSQGYVTLAHRLPSLGVQFLIYNRRADPGDP